MGGDGGAESGVQDVTLASTWATGVIVLRQTVVSCPPGLGRAIAPPPNRWVYTGRSPTSNCAPHYELN